jgi:hypothetical protein
MIWARNIGGRFQVGEVGTKRACVSCQGGSTAGKMLFSSRVTGNNGLQGEGAPSFFKQHSEQARAIALVFLYW